MMRMAELKVRIHSPPPGRRQRTGQLSGAPCRCSLSYRRLCLCFSTEADPLPALRRPWRAAQTASEDRYSSQAGRANGGQAAREGGRPLSDAFIVIQSSFAVRGRDLQPETAMSAIHRPSPLRTQRRDKGIVIAMARRSRSPRPAAQLAGRSWSGYSSRAL